VHCELFVEAADLSVGDDACASDDGHGACRASDRKRAILAWELGAPPALLSQGLVSGGVSRGGSATVHWAVGDGLGHGRLTGGTHGGHAFVS
jgi:hypothetical protein